MLATHNITINPPRKTTYGLYHIWIIWNITTISTITTTIHNTGINERVKRVLYTIYQQMKRYNHFNTTIYHTGQEQDYKTLSTYFNSTTYHHITLPQDERTTTNNIFILQPTRGQDTTDGTIPPYKTTSI